MSPLAPKMARNQMSANEILRELTPQKRGGMYQKAWSDFLTFAPLQNR